MPIELSPSFEGPSRRRFVQTAGAGMLGLPLAANAASAAQPSTRPGSSTPPPLAPPDEQPPDLEVPEPGGPTVGYAVVGLGTLALGEVMPAFADCKYARPVALVSGHRDKAEKVAQVYGIESKNIYNYDNYDTIADNPDVDVIYVILPNHMHAEYTIRGLQAGKQVLCEKPMAPTIGECERMIAAADEAGKQLMIAYRLHYEPYNQTVMELCRKQAYGEVKTFSATDAQTTTAPNIRLSEKTAGGPVRDIGIYCINAARYVTHEEPVEVTAYAHQPQDNPNFREVPESVVFTLRFPSGKLAHCGCSFGTEESRRFRVNCAKGWIDLDPAFSYRGLRMRVRQNEKETMLDLPQVNQFASEMDHFAECILNNKPNWTPGAEGLADMRVVEAVRKSYQSGGTPVQV